MGVPSGLPSWGTTGRTCGCARGAGAGVASGTSGCSGGDQAGRRSGGPAISRSRVSAGRRRANGTQTWCSCAGGTRWSCGYSRSDAVGGAGRVLGGALGRPNLRCCACVHSSVVLRLRWVPGRCRTGGEPAGFGRGGGRVPKRAGGLQSLGVVACPLVQPYDRRHMVMQVAPSGSVIFQHSKWSSQTPARRVPQGIPEDAQGGESTGHVHIGQTTSATVDCLACTIHIHFHCEISQLVWKFACRGNCTVAWNSPRCAGSSDRRPGQCPDVPAGGVARLERRPSAGVPTRPDPAQQSCRGAPAPRNHREEPEGHRGRTACPGHRVEL